jgi:hypothetical protein
MLYSLIIRKKEGHFCQTSFFFFKDTFLIEKEQKN